MRKKSTATRYIAQRLVLAIAASVALSACNHSDQSSEKKDTGLNAGSSAAAQQVNKPKQSTSKDLIPYFNRPPVGTPIETH